MFFHLLLGENKINRRLLLRLFFAKRVALQVGDKGADITNPYNEERNGLEKKVYEVAVLPIKGNIIAPTEEEIDPDTKL